MLEIEFGIKYERSCKVLAKFLENGG